MDASKTKKIGMGKRQKWGFGAVVVFNLLCVLFMCDYLYDSYTDVCFNINI